LFDHANMGQGDTHTFFKKEIIYFTFVLCALSFFVFPITTFAQSVYLTQPDQSIYQDDTFVVEVKISSFDKHINVVDGVLSFDPNIITVKELSTGDSIFSLWAEEPTFSNIDGTISFVGGAPEGFNGEDGLVVKVIFLARGEGETELTFSEDFLMFLSDGKGTKVSPERKPLTVVVLKRPPDILPKDEWQAFIDEDTTPPEPFEALISRDPTLFDNQYFVSFFTTDKGSGIAYYEAKEGDRDFVRARSPYLLRDQSLEGIMQIKAVDRAGNEIVITPIAPPLAVPYDKYLIWIIWALLGLILAFVLQRSMKRSRKNER